MHRYFSDKPNDGVSVYPDCHSNAFSTASSTYYLLELLCRVP